MSDTEKLARLKNLELAVFSISKRLGLLIRQALARFEVQVLTHTSVDKGIEAVLNDPVHVVLIDGQLKDALRVASSIVERADATGIVLISACVTRAQLIEAFQAGVTRILVRPFSLTTLLNDGQQSGLVRTWAAAGLVSLAPDVNRLATLANYSWTFPALNRPLEKRLVALLTEAGDGVDAADLLNLSMRMPSLQQTIARRILGLSPESLIDLMLTHENQQIRRLAAAYLGTMAQQGGTDGTAGVAAKVAEALEFDADAKDVPWKGGPLFVPGIAYEKEDARALVGELLRWHLWLDRHDRRQEQRQIHNNLINGQLGQAAGYHSPGWQETSTEQWLVRWARVVGLTGIEEILAEQGVMEDEKYGRVLQAF